MPDTLAMPMLTDEGWYLARESGTRFLRNGTRCIPGSRTQSGALVRISIFACSQFRCREIIRARSQCRRLPATRFALALIAMTTVVCSRGVALSVLIGVGLGLGSLGFPSIAHADIFMYTDANGVQHFTNVPGNTRYELVLTEGGSQAKTPAPILVPGRDRGRERYALPVAYAAADTGLPESLLHAVIKAESNYNPDAVSRKGAVGLMQLMPETARRFGVLDARDPGANVLGGARYLKTLLTLFDADLALALAAYNAGPAAVLRSRRAVPPYPETQRYVPRVLELYRRNAGQ